MKEKQKIGPYTVLFPIKKGSYAQCYRVSDAKGNKMYLKLFNLAKLSDLQIEENITDITEINIISKLNHPNIELFVDRGEVVMDGQRFVYMVCNFIAGETVLEKIRREKYCSVFEIKQIISGVLNALKYLHRLEVPVIHNDIQPDNIMLDMSGTSSLPVLIDFGHAQYLDNKNRKLFPEGINLFYMAPEMFKGLYSTRTDLYSVGVLLYHLLFGIVPWFVDLSKVPRHEYVNSLLNERRNKLRIPDLKIFELDEQLIKVVAKSLNQDVDKRFQSADEFLRALNGEIEISDAEYDKISNKTEDTKDQKAQTNVKKGNGFADVAGLDDLKERLQNEVIDLIKNPEKYSKLRVKIPNGLLLYGPPGCGKTFIAEKFAEEIGCNYMYIHCSDVASPYIHGGQEKIASVFEQAKSNAPTILFLDELDAMLADRSKHTNISEYGEVNEFLTHLNNCADDKIFVIGATNNPKGIDSAALRSGRLDIKVYVPNPDEKCREALLKLYLKDIVVDDIDYNKLVNLTDGYVSRDICSLVNKAALITAQANLDLITMDLLLKAVEQCRGELPSVSKETLMAHEKMRDEFEGRTPERKRVGFR